MYIPNKQEYFVGEHGEIRRKNPKRRWNRIRRERDRANYEMAHQHKFTSQEKRSFRKVLKKLKGAA